MMMTLEGEKSDACWHPIYYVRALAQVYQIKSSIIIDLPMHCYHHFSV